MNKTIKLTLTLAVILSIVGFLYFNKYQTKAIPTENVNSISDIKGCYVARLDKDVYTLTISDDNNGKATGALVFKNFEKDSSSGIFTGTFKDGILLGDYSFESEGMNSVRQVIFKKDKDKFIEGFGPVTVVDNRESLNDILDVTYDQKLTFVKSATCDNKISYIQKDGVFSFSYNPNFTIQDVVSIPTSDWRFNNGGQTKGTLLSTLLIPRSYMPNTNFSEARLTVGRSTNTKDIKSCTVKSAYEDPTVADEEISGLPFKRFSSSDAGAGNFYETTSYRAIVDGDCYAIEYTIHSTNIGNYSPDQGVKEFDKTKVINEMNSIVKSFKFILNSN